MKLYDVLKNFNLLNEISIKEYDEIDMEEYSEKYFEGIQKLYEKEEWMTPIYRQKDAKEAWNASQVTLVLLHNETVIGSIRAITDGLITTYIAELIIAKEYRGRGFGNLLIEICHLLYPKTRLDLLSSEDSEEFYRLKNCREITGFRKNYH